MGSSMAQEEKEESSTTVKFNVDEDAPDSIVIKSAGNPAVCGVYQNRGEWDLAHRYSKKGEYEGRPVEYSIFRCTVSNNTKHWYISIVPSNKNPGTTSDIAYYAAPVTEDCRHLPPQDGWITVDEGKDPLPLVVFQSDGVQQTNHGASSRKEGCTPNMSLAHDEEESSNTVKFNVGGKLYEVSKSLLKGFPYTVLAEKAFSASFSSPVFIDRDADRFAFCLDYMRDNGNVYLPETVSKKAFLADLKYFGFAFVDERKIRDEKSQQNCLTRFHQIVDATRQKIVRSERDLERRNEEIKMEKVALKCLEASVLQKQLSEDGSYFLVEYREVEGATDVHTNLYFKEYCDKFGLQVFNGATYSVWMGLKANFVGHQ